MNIILGRDGLNGNLDPQRCQFLVNEILDFRLVLCCQMVEAILGFQVLGDGFELLGLDIDLILPVFELPHGPHSGLDGEFCYLDGLIGREAPSKRYGSAPSDGPCQGKGISSYWKKMRERYYEGMGWDKETGWPLPETLEKLNLDELIPDLPEKAR